MSARIESRVFSAVSFFSCADDEDGLDAPGDGVDGPGDDDDDDAVHSVALPPALVVPVAHATHAPSFRYWLVVHDGVTAALFL